MIPNIQRLIEVAESARVIIEWGPLPELVRDLDETLAKLDADEGKSVEDVGDVLADLPMLDDLWTGHDDVARAALRAIGWEDPKDSTGGP